MIHGKPKWIVCKHVHVDMIKVFVLEKTESQLTKVKFKFGTIQRGRNHWTW